MLVLHHDDDRCGPLLADALVEVGSPSDVVVVLAGLDDVARAATTVAGHAAGSVVLVAPADDEVVAGAAAGLCRRAARERAPAVRVNLVVHDLDRAARGGDQALDRRSLRRPALRRAVTVADVAAAVRFLAGAGFVTGCVLPVDAGRTMGRGPG